MSREMTTNFWKLLQDYSIEIPIIQRDYAQGRTDAITTQKRQSFLKALHGALVDENKTQTLDFIYGDVIIEDGQQVLQPLDGQQRLTTLFLLHWYIAVKENNAENNLSALAIPVLSRFRYETRVSSREFCERLVHEPYSMKVSQAIRASNWWVLSWEKDPTISGMLVTLDEIQEMFTEDGLWAALMENNITFTNIPLKEFGLSDDLYVKMNARGKQLTDFENWKASFEKHLDTQAWDSRSAPCNVFKQNIDTVWSDFFWYYRDEHNRIDAFMLNFIRETQFLSVAIHVREDMKELTLDHFPYYEPCSYRQCDYEFLFETISIWKSSISWLRRSYDHSTPIERIMRGSASYSARVLFYAETLAAKNNIHFASEAANDWLRVVGNIVQHTSIDSYARYILAVRLVRELSAGCRDIYRYLAHEQIKSKFASAQVTEEITKAQLINSRSEWKGLIIECEETALCEGRISFAFKCLGCYKDITNFQADLFVKCTAVISGIFSQIEINRSLKHLMWSSLLTIGDTNFYQGWKSKLNMLDCPKYRIPNGLKEMRDFCNQESKGTGGSQAYAIELVRKLMECDIEHYLQSYSPPSNMPRWKQQLIKNSELFQACTCGYLCVSGDDSQCWLLDGVKPRRKEKCKLIL